ncbi:hypothetical protein CHLRE_08g358459v5 [Chlamydomonas reinhardtii]|uniref:Uncharacterized protein n=1 Tax=Chlamydomonas reinhardtii TaxID=3055 RepID=A0A2K3DG43_CHLRE|nr:uncharacterized protein CHLRE_08g358459v5 [Chlamydomonas reinhardtii]PNW79513.1 hypothetical protein CHLRE_08g358459v5 [Chlamydomonas reinhardtii]
MVLGLIKTSCRRYCSPLPLTADCRTTWPGRKSQDEDCRQVLDLANGCWAPRSSTF